MTVLVGVSRLTKAMAPTSRISATATITTLGFRREAAHGATLVGRNSPVGMAARLAAYASNHGPVPMMLPRIDT